MPSYSWTLQQAVFAALNAASISGVQSIVDHPKENTPASAFPIIHIGDVQSIQDDVSCADGSEEYFDIHTWTRGRGFKQCLQIMGAIHDALHNKSLTVTGLSSAHSFVTSERTFSDPDGKTRHGVTTIKINCREA